MKNNILTIDIGNTNSKYIIYNQYDQIVYHQRLNTVKEISEIKAHLLEFFSTCSIGFELVVISCVVPSINDDYLQQFKSFYHGPIEIISGSVANLTINNPNANEVGADMVASAIGALGLTDQHIQVIDMGSASKISVIYNNRLFAGCVIAPGIGLQIKTIHHNIPHLPQIDISLPKKIVNNTTIPCIQSGILYGSIEAMIGLSRRIEEESALTFKKFLTGGYANLFTNYPHDFIHVEDLVSYGLLLHGRSITS